MITGARRKSLSLAGLMYAKVNALQAVRHRGNLSKSVTLRATDSGVQNTGGVSRQLRPRVSVRKLTIWKVACPAPAVDAGPITPPAINCRTVTKRACGLKVSRSMVIAHQQNLVPGLASGNSNGDT